MAKSEWDMEADQLEQEEMFKVVKNMGSPHLVLAKNLTYLIEKYSVKIRDFTWHYHHLTLSRKALYNVKTGKKVNVSSIFLCIITNFFNEAHGTNLSLADMYTDLEARDAFEGLKNK